MCSMLALKCQYIYHVLYSKLDNNIQPEKKSALNTLTELIVMSPKIIVNLDAQSYLNFLFWLIYPMGSKSNVSLFLFFLIKQK